MFSDENVARLQEISTRIAYILNICEKNGSISNALQDIENAQPAIVMHLIVCNQYLQKLQDDFSEEVMQIFSKEDIRGLKTIRNIASHDYQGLNLAIIERVIREHLPIIKEKIDSNIADSHTTTDDLLKTVESAQKEQQARVNSKCEDSMQDSNESKNVNHKTRKPK